MPKRSFRSVAARLWCRSRKMTDRTPSRLRLEVPEDEEVVAAPPLPEGAGEVVVLDPLGARHAHRRLQVEREPGLDRLDDRRRAAGLAELDGGQVPVVPGGRVEDGSASRLGRDAVREEPPVRDEETGRPRPAEELVDREEDRVEPRVGIARGVHVDVDVGSGGGEVEEGEGAVPVEDAGEGVDVVQDAGDVRGGAERPDLPGTVLPLLELGVEVLDRDAPRLVEVDVDRVADRLAPGDVVGVVLHHRPEDDGTGVLGDLLRQVVALLELVGDAQAQDVDEPVDRAGRPRADRDEDVFLRRADVARDLREGRLVVVRHQAAGVVALGVGVRHEGEDLLGELLLDVGVETPRGDEVEVAKRLQPGRRRDRGGGAEDAGPKAVEERALLGFGRGRDGRARSARGGVDEA